MLRSILRPNDGSDRLWSSATYHDNLGVLCAIDKEKRLSCIGREHHGQLGRGTALVFAAPVVIVGLYP